MLRDKIISANDNKVQQVTVPEWDCDLFLRCWTGSERATFQDWFSDAKSKADLYGQVLVLSIADEHGKRIFTHGDIEALQAKNGQVLERLTVAALRLNGITSDAVADAKNG